MAFGKRRKVKDDDVVSGVDSVDVGAAQPPKPPSKPVLDPEVEGLVGDVSARFGGLYGAGVSPDTVLAAEAATLLVAILAELRRVNDNLGLLLVEVRK